MGEQKVPLTPRLLKKATQKGAGKPPPRFFKVPFFPLRKRWKMGIGPKYEKWKMGIGPKYEKWKMGIGPKYENGKCPL